MVQRLVRIWGLEILIFWKVLCKWIIPDENCLTAMKRITLFYDKDCYGANFFNPLNANPTKLFDRFVGLAAKELRDIMHHFFNSN